MKRSLPIGYELELPVFLDGKSNVGEPEQTNVRQVAVSKSVR
jgi:hypothetical protein